MPKGKIKRMTISPIDVSKLTALKKRRYYEKLRETIENNLVTYANFNPEIDFILLDNLMSTIYLVDDAFSHIQNDGSVLNVSKQGHPVFQRSPHVAVLLESQKQLEKLSKMLGLSALDRVNMGIAIEEADDGF